MTYNDLRRSIYESYQSGEISGPQATQMLEKVMDIEGDHIVAEYEALENTFMGVAMELQTAVWISPISRSRLRCILRASRKSGINS